MTARLTQYLNITPPSLWQHCIHLHGNIVTIRAGVGYKMGRFVVNFDLFASASSGATWPGWERVRSLK